jgi:hypothetical protein
MISRRSKKPFLKYCLSLLMLVACALVLQTLAAGPSYGQAAAAGALAKTPTPIPTLVPDGAIQIYHKRFLAEYDSVVQEDSAPVQSSTAAPGDTRGSMHVIADDAPAVYDKRAIGVLTDAAAYRFRHYVDPNGISMPDRSEITLTQLRKASTMVETRLQYAPNCYRLYVRYVDDDGAWYSLPVAFISDAGHYIEVLVEFASSPTARDGRITYWIDDLAIGRHESLDLYDKSRRPDHVHLGAPWVSDATISGALYVDEFVLREGTEHIGHEDTQPAAPWATPRLTQALPVHAP